MAGVMDAPAGVAARIRALQKTRVQELGEFGRALKEMDPRDDELFRFAITYGAEVLCLTHQQIAEAFAVSRPSVTRWINGKNAPHPALRPTIYRWLAEQSAAKQAEARTWYHEAA